MKDKYSVEKVPIVILVHRLRTAFEGSVLLRVGCEGRDLVDLSTVVVALLSRVGLLRPFGLVVLCVILPSTFDVLLPRRGDRE